jgi:hypothetical protein
MKSRRLQGVHRLIDRLPVEIDVGDYVQRVASFIPQSTQSSKVERRSSEHSSKRWGICDCSRTRWSTEDIPARVEHLFNPTVQK